MPKKKNITQPRDDEPRDESWYRRWQQYQWGLYSSGYGGLGFSDAEHCGIAPWGRSIPELRAYARGKQGVSKYMEILDPKDDDGNNVMGVSWDTLKMAANQFAVAKRRIRLVDFKPGTEGSDSMLGEKRTRIKARMKGMLDPRFMQMSRSAGLDAGVRGFNSQDDVEDFAQMGLVVLEQEADMKDLLDRSEDISGFAVLKDMLVDDSVECGVMAVDVVVVGGKVRYKYIDIDRLVYRRSQFPDCRDIDFAGYWEEKTIGQIRDESGFDEDTLKLIAKSGESSGIAYGVSDGYNSGREDLYDKRMNSIDDHKVKVFKSYWVAMEAEDFIAGTYVPTGGRMFRKKPDNYSERSYFDGGETSVSTHYVYTSNLVLGTNHVYGTGKIHYQVREDGNCMLPIRIWQSDKPSMAEKAIPIIDQIELEWKGVQNFLAKLPPAPRLVYDQSLLEEYVSLGGKNRDTYYVAEKFEKTGRLIVRSINEHGDPSMGANRLPITPIELNIAQELATRMNYIAQLKADLREMTGINELADGTLNQNDMLVGVAESLDMATNMVLGEYVEAWRHFYSDVCKYSMNRWKTVLRYEPQKVGGSNGAQREIGKEIAEHDFNIRLVPVMTEKSKQFMLQYLAGNRNEGKIDEADFFSIFNMIEEGDMKKAQFYLVKAIARKTAQARQEQERMIMLQGEQTKAAGVAVEQQRARTEQLKQVGVRDRIRWETEGELLIEKEKMRGMKEIEKMRLSNQPKND